MQRQIRLDKFEQVLPRAMRENGIDMWIVAVKENHYDPLWNDLGRGYVSGIGYYVFTDRGGDRIERAALGPSGYMLSESGAYDIIAAASTLADHVKARNPKRIGLNMSDQIGPADGLRWDNRGHFFAAAAAAMRRILVDAARRKRTHKHGGNRRRVELPDVPAEPDFADEHLLALDAALTRLAAEDPVAARVVELRHFTGLSIEDVAADLGLSRATAYRHWTYARAWLKDAVSGTGPS